LCVLVFTNSSHACPLKDRLPIVVQSAGRII
jgi:hypothetical protein